jgi:hypothetical protein
MKSSGRGFLKIKITKRGLISVCVEKFVAGEDIKVDNLVYVGDDGKVYKSKPVPYIVVKEDIEVGLLTKVKNGEIKCYICHEILKIDELDNVGWFDNFRQATHFVCPGAVLNKEG